MDPILTQMLIGLVPADRELGGVFRGRGPGKFEHVELVAGPICVNDSVHIGKCHVMLPPAGPNDVRFHTHPKANRPSSIDIANARSTSDSYVFSPLGAWAYRHFASWDALTRNEQRQEVLHWRLVGGLMEPMLQTGSADAARLFSRALGPHASASFTAVEPTSLSTTSTTWLNMLNRAGYASTGWPISASGYKFNTVPFPT
jgi:hypothetical protein